jgi:hypothetical protein
VPKLTSKKKGRVSARVRMYRQGLGDCFLLRFPKSNGEPFHIVIDSGVIKGTKDPSIIMREVAEDIERETGGVIDALVVTHEHWDHVSGFSEAREVWKRMTIREAWLAWTEKPGNDLADKLRKERTEKRKEIVTRIMELAAGSSLRLDALRSARIDSLLGFLGMDLAAAGEGGGTKEALDFISKHAKARVYHKPGATYVPKGLDGVRVHVLGPPEDEKKLKKSDPSKTKPEVYADPARAFAFGGAEGDDGEEDLPFGPSAGVPVTNGKRYDTDFAKYFPTLAKDGPDPHWRRLSFESIVELEKLALALDGDTNNTSLALAFELGDGRVLLFPADAQVGNWLSWHDYEWKAGARKVTAEALLARTIFYKVGHHGSHNATLKDLGLEMMTARELIAFIPVNKAMARKKHWKMPFRTLYERLIEKTRGRVVLADASVALPAANELEGLTAMERENFSKSVTATGLYIDFAL